MSLGLVGDLIRLIVAGYLDPRGQTRAILGRASGFTHGFLLSILGGVIGILLGALVRGPGVAEGPAVSPLTAIATTVVLAVGMFLLASWLLYRVGRAFGGRGTLDQAFVVLGWNNLVGSPLSLLQAVAGGAPALGTASPGDIAIVALYLGVALWLMAASAAELHGFARTLRVFGFLLAVPVGAGVVLALLAGIFAALSRG